VIVNLLNYLVTLRKKIGRIDGGRIARTVIFSTAASLVMAAVVHWTFAATAPWFNLEALRGQLVHALLVIGAGVLVYLGLAYLLRMPELAYVREAVRPRRRDQRRGGPDEGTGLGG